ncbi:MAG: zinc ribbon domain-containing protein, partial [Bacteriovoracaceae bacterium]
RCIKSVTWCDNIRIVKLFSLIHGALTSGGHLELVPARYTSTKCSNCLYNDKENRKGKVFKCLNCGFEEDADKNASLNIDREGRSRCGHGGVLARESIEVATSIVQ